MESGRISLSDNFFELGGSSSNETQLAKFYLEEYKSPLPLDHLTKHPTLKEFCNNLGQPTGQIPKSSLKNVALDCLKCLPSFLYFNLFFAFPSLVMATLFLFHPILALALVSLEFLTEKTIGLPTGNFLERIFVLLNFSGLKFSSIQIIEEVPLEKLPRTIFSFCPHGNNNYLILPFEEFLFSRNVDFKIILHEILFKIPFSKTFFSLCGGLPAKKQSYCLAERNNFSLLVTPGDTYEAFFGDEPTTIALRGRMHFFKYALESGTSITPVFCFNVNQFFFHFKHFHNSRLWLLEHHNAAFIQPFHGRWYLPIPFKKDLKFVIGSPIIVEKKAHPSCKVL
jgi:1-acyl-sn-glycerol-3-phosphate acyltransferase